MHNDVILTEAVETCPYCVGENVYTNWNVRKQGFIAKCQHCGKKIMLCDECLHCSDNKHMKCDWHMEGSENVCFRGRYKE